MENNLLLVPVQVDSLFLAEDKLMAEPMAEFSRLPYFNGKRDVNSDVAYVSENFIAPPLQNRNLRFRAGLHLHWALPAALTHGVHKKSANDTIRESIDYPALPDRWLVHRELEGASKQWLVESTFLWPEEVIYTELEAVEAFLKKAIRLVRNFEALPEETRNSLTEEAKTARLREVTDSLRNANSALQQHLNDPDYAFFEGLFVRNQIMIYRLEEAETDIENAGLDDLRPALTKILYDFFDHRRESISFPIQAANNIRPPKGLDQRLNKLQPLIRTALRTANSLIQAWDILPGTKRLDYIELLKQNLLQWLSEPDESDSTKFKFVESANSPEDQASRKALIDRVLAEPLTLMVESGNVETVFKKYDRFYKFNSDDEQVFIEYNTAKKNHTWPPITLLKAAPDLDTEALELSVLDDCLTQQFEALDTNSNVEQNDIVAVADALLSVLNANATETLVPHTQQPFRYLGRSVLQTTPLFREDRNAYEYLDKLTVLGYGEPTFAAFYPNCSSVLGFQDMEIIAGQEPKYTILGWYDRAEDAFLSYLQTRAGKTGDFDLDFLKEYAKWELPDGSNPLPAGTRIACFSQIQHKSVTDASDKKEDDAGNTTITLANTGREALAALLAHKVVETENAEEAKIPQIEDQLESIFFIDDLDQHQLDIGPKFRETRHAQGFNAVPGERIYEIRPEKVEIATDASGANPVSPKLPQDVISALKTLNSKQRSFDNAVFERDSLREQLFVDWYKYMLSAYPPQDAIIDYPDVDEVRFFVEQHDIRPLLDLMFQTGQISLEPKDYWSADPGPSGTDGLGFAPISGITWEKPSPNYHAELGTAGAELQTALDTFNNKLAADIQRPDITDWGKLIDSLSQPELPAALNGLFGQLGNTEMAAGLTHLQSLKTQVLDVLKAGWQAAASYTTFMLDRYGLRPEPSTELRYGHILNWNGLLAMLRQKNPDKAQAEVDLFMDQLADKTQFENDLSTFYASTNGAPSIASTLEAASENIAIMLDSLKAIVGTGNAAIQKRDELAEALPKSFRPAPKFVLKQISGPRFYEPKEPTVLIAGDIAAESKRFARESVQNANGNFEFGAWQIIAPTGTTGGILEDYDEIKNLLDTENGPDKNPIGYYESDGSSWNPFMLEWSVELCPLQEHSNARDGDYQDDYVLHHYDLKFNAVDLEEKGDSSAIRGRNPNIYINRSLLTTQAFRSMEDQLKPYLEANDPTTLDAASKNLDNAIFAADKANTALQNLKGKILAQSLSGFNAAMLMLQQNLQIPVDDPIGFSDYKNFTAAVAQLVGFGTKRAPNPLTDFSPIRTGKLQINTLHLVDTFGRIANLKITNSTVLHSSLGNISGDGQENSKGVVENPISLSIPPRLAMPARLHFRWLSAEHDPELTDDIIPESVDDLSSTPVCGWLMANQLDRSLVVFDAKGLSLGAIDSDAGTVRWRPAPGWESLTDSTLIENPHLNKVVAYLLAQTDAYIEKFIDETNTALSNIEPTTFEQQQSLALLMGRPMAVVRANIDLEQKGVPAVHHGWNSFYRDRQDGNFERETDEYRKVRYPIRIGSVSQLNDGLVGYWLENESEALNSNFYLNNEATTNPEPAINYLEDDTPISQSLETNDPDQTVCILMDPRAKIHAFTGILPTKIIDIPAEQYLSALQAIDITFLTTPVLTPAERISVPRSIEEGYEWQWIEQTSVKNAPIDKGTWVEVPEYATMPENIFLNHFSGILLKYLVQNRWLNPDDQKALPVAERPLLAPEFSLLKDLLIANTPAGTVITSAQLNPVSKKLIGEVLVHADVGWVEKIDPSETENPDTVYRILPKEARQNSKFTGTEFAGFEARVDAILTTGYLGFRPAVENGQFFPESVWIREGWLKLQKKNS